MLEPLSLSLLIAVLFLAVLLVISYLVFILPSKIEKTDSQAKDSTEIKELREKLSTQSQELNIDFRRETFDRLQNLLTNYPTVR